MTSLGTLSAGSIITQAGTWDRDDSCRSANATSSQQIRYYADYFSFTVSETTEVRLRLSSSQGKRLYLLKGAGTGGDVITSRSDSNSATASIVRSLAAGTYTIEATTYSSAAEGEFWVSVDSNAEAPSGACVTALGAVAAGSIVTRPGAWDRDDRCGSVNAPTSPTAFYYAEYFSFTVSEAVDVRITLSSSQGKRLYLLKGAGTGGDVITSHVVSSSSAPASIVRALEAGTYTLETAARYSTREGDFWVSIDSMAATPPAGCVTSLGALAAGSVTTQVGSWDRDDGCRSVNATTSQSTRYYADYFSFTVSEAVDVRISLSSSQGKRLYLLKGAGTGGDVITSHVVSSSSAPASIVRALEAGTYTLETTARYSTREGDFWVSIDSMAATPPAGCVTSLGALAAGSVTTQVGSWDREDGCRSVNATTSQSTRYYAEYFSFTVSEAVDARLTLISSSSARLYLLNGEGTGSALIVSAGHSRSTSNPSLRRVLQPGTYTIETAAHSARVEANFALSISLAVLPPTRGDALEAEEIQARLADEQVDVSGAFNGTVDSYAATSSDESIVTTSVDGSVVTLNGVAVGAATVAVTATNVAGSTSQSFAVTVRPVTAAPEASGTLASQTVAAGASVEVDVAAAFTGTVDSYGAVSSDTAVVSVTASGSVVTLEGVAAGAATVTVTAMNTVGSATQTLAVTVESAAPEASGTLASQTVAAGASVEVDVGGAFSGAVDTYTVTSSNGAVLDIALAGSVVTLTGAAAGSATVTVVAANIAGSATQNFAVTVSLPPAPTLGIPLAAQTLQDTETLTIDVAAGFNGPIDTYTATSGDTNRLTVTVDGSAVSLTGVAVGSTTVTVTAINAAGRAARSFTVTVTALTAPRTAGTPLARTVAVGAEVPLHIADAFSGIVHTYTATSSDTTKLTTSVDGSTVTLLGAAAGTATVTLTAANTAGSATQTFTATVETPDDLTLAVNAPSHCLGSEGTLAPGGGRRGVGHIDVTYHITGGAGPYTVTSPDAPDTTHTEPTGTITISCAQRGIDLTTAGPDVNVVEAGPRTLTITATDNTTASTTTNLQIETAEDAYTTEYNGGQMHPRRTYVLGTPDQWVLITLPEGLTLQFTGLSEAQRAHFQESSTGAEIILNWHTGQEIHRSVPTATTNGATGTSSQRQRSVSTVTPLLNQLSASVLVPGETFTRNSVNGSEWRPYRGLPSNTSVALHPKLFQGLALNVCINEADTKAEFETDATATVAINNLATSINNAVNLWNSKTGQRSIGARLLQGLTHDVFEFDTASPACAEPSSGDVRLQVRTSDIECGRTVGAAGCAHWRIKGDPPQVTGNRIEIASTLTRSQYVVAHELGHFLGLGDYGYVCPTRRIKLPGGIVVKKVDSLMAYELSGCDSDTVEDRDLDDLSSIYHPLARTGVEIRAYVGLGPASHYVHTGDLAQDFNGNQVEVAHKYAFFERELTRGSAWTFVRWYDLSSVNGLANQGGRIDISYDPWSSVYELTERPRIEYMIVGVAKGDHKMIEGLSQGIKYSVLRANDEYWSLGTPAIAADPARPGSGTDSSEEDSDGTGTTDGRGGPAAAISGESYCPVNDGYSWDRWVDDDGDWWCDRVKIADVASTTVERCDVVGDELRVGADGAWVCAQEVSGTLRSRAGPPECLEGFSLVAVLVGGVPQQVCSKTDREAATSTPGCPAGYMMLTLQSEVCYRSVPATAATTTYSCPDEYSLVSIPMGGQQCRKTVPASSKTTYSCSGDYSLVMFFVQPGVEGYRCEKSAPAASKTTYSCPDEYSLVSVPMGGQYCRKTVPASSKTTYSCSGDYSLVMFFVQPGVEGYRCEKSAPAASKTTYSCSTGYSLVSVPMGGQYCRKTTAATAKYSCDSGYTLSGTTCSKYTYTSPTGRTCPSGYTPFFNGFAYLCRKKLTTTATVTYSCSSGTLSGSNCVFTATPTSKTTYSCTLGRLSGSNCVFTTKPTPETTYSCSSGRLSGSNCVFTTTPTPETTYSCSSGRLSGSNCILTATPTSKTTYSCSSGRLSASNCVFTATPTPKTTYSCTSGRLSGSNCILTTAPIYTYDCDDAPDGYELSGSECTKTTTAIPTPTTINYCDDGYELNTENNTCNKTITTVPNKITTHSCPTDQGYQLTTIATATTTTRTCKRTITIAAETGPPMCPPPPEGEASYTLTITTNSDGQTTHTCTNNAADDDDDDDETTLPPPLS